MPKILLIGNGPLPGQGKTHAHNAASLRTYFFKKAMLKADIKLVTVLIELSEESGAGCNQHHQKQYSFHKDDKQLFKKIEAIISDENPDGIVSVNTYPSFIASQLKTKLPLWCDLNGWIMAEAQSQAGVMKSDVLLSHYWNFEQIIIKRADRFSTVSTPQKFALIGELATIGRLNQHTNNEPLTQVIPNYFEAIKPTPNRKRNNNEFHVFWCGGYNTWVDEMTLFKGLEYAMERNDKVRLVSTGGTIKGLDDITFANFKRRIEQSKFKDRFKFLGWVEQNQLPQLFADADCGINVDLANYESEIGARNRLNEMLVRGLPIITSVNAEITQHIIKAGIAEGFKSGDYKAFAEAILKLNNKPELRQHYAQQGQAFAKENYDYLVHTSKLREWCKNPIKAKDADKKVNIKKMNPLKAIHYSLKKDGIKRTIGRIMKRLR